MVAITRLLVPRAYGGCCIALHCIIEQATSRNCRIKNASSRWASVNRTRLFASLAYPDRADLLVTTSKLVRITVSHPRLPRSLNLALDCLACLCRGRHTAEARAAYPLFHNY